MITLIFHDNPNNPNLVNTAQILGSFKEIMVDKSLDGLSLPRNIFWVGAINPVRADVSVDEKEDLDEGKRAHLDMYNVRPLPASMYELIWDYGALNEEQERDYIRAKLGLWSDNLRRQTAQDYRSEALKLPNSESKRKAGLLASGLHVLVGSRQRLERDRKEEEDKFFDPDLELHNTLKTELICQLVDPLTSSPPDRDRLDDIRKAVADLSGVIAAAQCFVSHVYIYIYMFIKSTVVFSYILCLVQ